MSIPVKFIKESHWTVHALIPGFRHVAGGLQNLDCQLVETRNQGMHPQKAGSIWHSKKGAHAGGRQASSRVYYYSVSSSTRLSWFQ